MTGSDVQLALTALADSAGCEGVIVLSISKEIELRAFPSSTLLGAGPTLAEALRKALRPYAAEAQRVELAFRSLGVVP